MNDTARQETCDERVETHRDSRLESLRLMLKPTVDDVELIDDGTLDTVLRCGDEEFRYDPEYVLQYRDDDAGELSDDFIEAQFDADICDRMQETFYEYGLSFDYVAPGTFGDQPEGYFRYQLSWGGPSDEIRFYTNPDFSMHRAEYWFLDWFDGASRDVTHDSTIEALWQIFCECSAEYAYNEAMSQ